MAGEGGAASAVPEDLLPAQADMLYEEEILRNPYSLKLWWRYLEARKDASQAKRWLLFERAVRALPGSYKLWHAYLTERTASVRGSRPDSPERASLAGAYERALVSMHKMPVIWGMFLDLAGGSGEITSVRRAYDRALRALPVTQHGRVWPGYLAFATRPGVPGETTARIYRRYLQLEPGHVEEFITWLRAAGRPAEAARRLAGALDDRAFRSLRGLSRHELWLELCELVVKHPEARHGLDADALIRSGIRRHPAASGRLWVALADRHVRAGRFERARDIYEEGLGSVITVRDFSLVYDALTQFEESLISAQLEAGLGGGDGDGDGLGAGEGTRVPLPDPYDPSSGPAPGEGFLLEDPGEDLDLRLARLEKLVESRPELLSAAVLRQNPHNVKEWLRRAAIYTRRGDDAAAARTLAEGARAVDPARASGGKPHALWAALAGVYEARGAVDDARAVFRRAVGADFAYADDCAGLWCEWAEMELRQGRVRAAARVVLDATRGPDPPRTRAQEQGLPARERAYRNPRLWALRFDLDESVGDLEAGRATFDSACRLGSLTASTLLNYADSLAGRGLHEEAFRAFERGLALFRPPHSLAIWRAYLAAFVTRYGGARLDRARELHRAALAALPDEQRIEVHLALADLEEKHGLARASLELLDAARDDVPREQRIRVVDAAAARASRLFGLPRVRAVYEAAIEAEPPRELPDPDVIRLCLRYAALETRLGEVSRARAVFVHGAHLADPRVSADYWTAWNEFEVQHGSEATFREMLRVRRSVTAAFSATHLNSAVADAVSAAVAAGDGAAAAAAASPVPAPAPAAAAGTRVRGFVSAGVVAGSTPDPASQDDGPGPSSAAAAADPEELALPDEEEGAEDADPAVQERELPAALFGGLPAKRQRTDGGGP